MKTLNFFARHKLAFLIALISLVALVLPGAIVFANENANEAKAPAATSNATITGSVLDSTGKAIPLANEPYVMIAGYDLLAGSYILYPEVDENGKFTAKDVPTTLGLGIITAGAKGYANEILLLEGTSFTFKLEVGCDTTFTNDEPKLDQYCLCGDSYVKLKGMSQKIYLKDFVDQIGLGAGLPVFGVKAGSTFTESSDHKTLTYHYSSGPNEEYNLVFRADPESGYKFNYWQINGMAVPTPCYTAVAGTDIIIDPYFTGGEPPVPPVTTDVSATLYDHDERTTPITEGGYAYIIGLRTTTGDLYLSDYGLTDSTGKFTIKDVPVDVFGVLIVGAPGYCNRGQLYSAEDYPATDFYLNKGVQCTVELPDTVSTVMLEKGSKINISIDGKDYGDLELDKDVDFGKYMLPFGMTSHGTFNFMDNGELNFSVEHNEVTIKSLSATFKVVPKAGYVFDCWQKDGEKISGEYTLSEGEEDFVISPVLTEVASTITYSAPIYNSQDEPLTNAYAYLLGFHSDTYKPYLSDIVGTDKNGVFTISNVPADVIGLIVVGAPGYVNRFQYVDAETPATFFTLKEGVQCSFNMPDTASTVYLAKGTCIKATFDIGGITVPFEYALEEDLDFGNFFVPFGMSADGTFAFNKDGSLSYSFTRSSNRFDINYLNLNIKVAPKEGYVFKDWLKDGEVVTGTEYKLEDGAKDFVLTPVFVPSTPTPGPTPVDPTINAKTFDSVEDWVIALAILGSAFAVVFSVRQLTRKKA